jgi:hypothetical protein
VPAKHRNDDSRAEVLLGNMMISAMAVALNRRKMAARKYDAKATISLARDKQTPCITISP